MENDEANTVSDDRQLVYVDRNVISHMLNPNVQDKSVASARCLARLVETPFVRDRFAFPYSYAHFQDMNGGSDEHLTRDLKQLLWLTSGEWIREEAPSQEIKLDRMHLEKHFHWWRSGQESSNGTLSDRLVEDAISKIENPELRELWAQFQHDIATANAETAGLQEPIDAMLAQIQDLTGAYFEEQALNVNEPELSNILGDLGASIRTMDGEAIQSVNRRIRIYSDKHPKIRTPNVSAAFLELDGNKFRRKVDETIKRSSFPYESAAEFLKILPVQSGFFSPFQADVQRLCTLSDFVRTTIEKKNATSVSIYTDQFHLAIGLRCHAFVSADQTMRARARFIKRWLELPVLILDAEGLVQHILKQLVRETHPHLSKAEVTFTFTFTFKENDGSLLRDFKVVA